MAVTVSEKPWSDYTKADYTPEQWHAACLIHQHDGAPTSKGQCKLPVKTPSGTLNRNGVHAAAAALAGARGGVNASPEEKAKAARALRGYYSQLDEEPPESLAHTEIEGFMVHFGVKGMKWGVRRTDAQLGNKPTPSEDKARATAVASRISKGHDTSALSNQELQSLVTRMNLESQYSKLISRPKPTPQTVKYIKTGAKFATTALAVGTFANRAYAFSKSPAGQKLVKELSKNKTKLALAKQAKAAADTGQGVLF